jgi:hypothetical protein
MLGYVSDASASQKGLTDKGHKAINAIIEPISLDELKKKLWSTDYIEVTEPEKMLELHTANKEKCKHLAYMARHERPTEAHPINGTGWFYLDGVSGGTAYVCLQRDFNEAMKGELVS